MKLKEVFNKKLVAWSVSLTMAFTMIPAMGTAVYADEPEDVQDNAAPVAEEQVSEEAEQGTSETSEEVDVVAPVEEETVAETSAATREKVSVSTEEETYTSSNKTDSDTLLMGYLNQELGVNQDAQLLSTDNKYYNQLSKTDKSLYSVLKNKAQAVATGKDANGQLEINYLDLDTDKCEWTAEELGIDYIYDLENEKWHPEAQKAFNASLPYDVQKVLNALLADMPYEMYWFDKTSTEVDGVDVGGLHTNLQGIHIADGGKTLVLDEDTTLNVLMFVSRDYSATGEIGTLDINVNKIEAVNKAIANAKNIVAENADLNDYNKLVAYKETICDLVSYNSDAASEDVETPYGDPWQLIYVFDGDEDTNVVCEGYSKSFQYLCDMSDFKFNTQCYSISGNLISEDEPEKPEPHMWNIVTMRDGINYLVDTTNCDEGTIGSPDELFLVSPAAGSPTEGYRFDISSGDCIYYEFDKDKMDEYGDIMYLNGDGKYDPIPNITSVELKEESAVYTGEAITPEVVVTDEYGETVDDSNYTVSTSPEIIKEVGEYNVKVTFKGDYEGSIDLTFNVTPAKDATAKLKNASAVYTGEAITPEVIVTDANGDAIDDSNYTVSTSPEVVKEVGEYTVKVTFKGNYEGSVDLTFNVVEFMDATAKLKSDSAVYTGKAITPVIVATDANGDVVDPSNYTVSTSPATVKNVGKYTVKVAFKGDYQGSASLTFKVNPVKTSVSKLTRGKKKFTVKWTKKSKSLVNGYQVQYSTSSTFASGNKTVTVKSYKTGSKTVKKLKAKKKYYVRVRTFKKVSGTYYYSPWSAAKAVTTK